MYIISRSIEELGSEETGLEPVLDLRVGSGFWGGVAVPPTGFRAWVLPPLSNS